MYPFTMTHLEMTHLEITHLETSTLKADVRRRLAEMDSPTANLCDLRAVIGFGNPEKSGAIAP